MRYDHLAHDLSRSRRSAARATRQSCTEEIVYPVAIDARACDWHDVTPRVGAAYDLFGNGKTAVKFNLGKYMEAFTAGNTRPRPESADPHDHQHDAGRGPTSNKDFVAELQPRRTPTQQRRVRRHGGQDPRERGVQPDLRSGLHHTATVSVRTTGDLASRSSRKSLPRVSVNVGYFRNWWGNWYAVDNRATERRRLHAVQYQGAGRSAAAWRRRPHRQRPV